MKLTSEEIALIEHHRSERARIDTAQTFQRKAIATAHAFSEWAEQDGAGLTFSTFVNAFNYEGEDLRKMYDAVSRILDAAWVL